MNGDLLNINKNKKGILPFSLFNTYYHAGILLQFATGVQYTLIAKIQA